MGPGIVRTAALGVALALSVCPAAAGAPPQSPPPASAGQAPPTPPNLDRIRSAVGRPPAIVIDRAPASSGHRQWPRFDELVKGYDLKHGPTRGSGDDTGVRGDAARVYAAPASADRDAADGV
jgi:hypothetical protein